MGLVEQKYHEQIDALTPQERVARAAEIFHWTREAIARKIVAESGPMSNERLKWLVALRLYGADPASRSLIEKVLQGVPD